MNDYKQLIAADDEVEFIKVEPPECKFFVTVNNKTVAENMTLEAALMLSEALFIRKSCHSDMVVAISQMPKWADL